MDYAPLFKRDHEIALWCIFLKVHRAKPERSRERETTLSAETYDKFGLKWIMAPKMTNGQNLPELNPLHFLTLVEWLEWVVVVLEFWRRWCRVQWWWTRKKVKWVHSWAFSPASKYWVYFNENCLIHYIVVHRPLYNLEVFEKCL